MQINLSKLLSIDGESQTYDAVVDMDEFASAVGTYRIVDKKPFSLTVTNVGKRKLEITGEGTLSLNIPCDRCLEDVKTDISFSIERVLDVDRLVYIELLVNLPQKVLCQPECKGLCLKCGANLNEGECGCDRVSLDPRMSVIQDIFKNFKEV